MFMLDREYFSLFYTMDGLSQNTALALIAIGIGTYFALSHFLGTNLDAREPPLASTAIPYIGHVIGMMRSKFNYYVKLRYYSIYRVI
jgi:hypothetical protein